MLVMDPYKSSVPKRHLTNAGVNIRHIYLPFSPLHGSHYLCSDFTWSAEPALEKQASQLSLVINSIRVVYECDC